MSWEAVIGLEIHVQLRTVTKMFCRCLNRYGDGPNTNVCPICLAHPGMLPVAKKDIELERLQMAIRDNILTPEVKANGFGGVDPDRLDKSIDQIGLTYEFKNKKPTPAEAFDASFLPSAADRKAN